MVTNVGLTTVMRCFWTNIMQCSIFIHQIYPFLSDVYSIICGKKVSTWEHRGIHDLCTFLSDVDSITGGTTKGEIEIQHMLDFNTFKEFNLDILFSKKVIHLWSEVICDKVIQVV